MNDEKVVIYPGMKWCVLIKEKCGTVNQGEREKKSGRVYVEKEFVLVIAVRTVERS